METNSRAAQARIVAELKAALPAAQFAAAWADRQTWTFAQIVAYALATTDEAALPI